MVIYIDNTIWEHGNELGLSEEEAEMFTELAIAHKHGRCMVCGDFKSIEWLYKNIGGAASSTYGAILSKYTETRAILGLVETFFVLSYNESPVVPSFALGKQRVINVSEAMHLQISNKCVLLCENLNDCIFYSLLGSRYCHTQGIKGANLALQHELGGGDTINQVYKKNIEDDRLITLCIVDSDIKYGKTPLYPDEPPKGQTASRLEAVLAYLKNTAVPAIYDLFCIPAHEIENLIPISIMKRVAECARLNATTGVEFLEILLDNKLYGPILLYDVKYGDIKIKTPEAKAYWDTVLNTVNRDSLPKVSSKMLEKSLVLLSENSSSGEPAINTMHIDSYLEPIWKKIGIKVFSWGCANAPIRS